MKSRCVVLILILCMILGTCACSLASSGDIEGFTEPFLQSNGFLDNGLNTPRDYAFLDDTFYTYMSDSQVYTWVPGDLTASPRYPLPKWPRYTKELYKDLSGSVKAELDNVVCNLVAYDEKLWAFNVFSGKFGEIGDSGIAWNEVRLDTSILLESGSAYPNSIWRPFVYGGKLYGYYDLSWEKPGDVPAEPVILAFDLAAGSCDTLEIPGTLDVCEYTPGYVLLLQKDGESSLALKKMSLATGEIGDVPLDIPVQLEKSDFADMWAAHYAVGGLAYNPAKDQIAFSIRGQVLLSTAGSPFAPAAGLPQDILIPNTKAWFLSDGRYAVQGGGIYVRNMN